VFLSRLYAWPAREAIEALTVAAFGFGIVFTLRGEHIERPVVGRVFDSGHVFAEGVPMDVVQTGAGRQFVGPVVDGDGVLVFSGVLVALVGDVDESGGIDIEGKLFGLCTFLCRLVSFTGCGLGLYSWSFESAILEDRCRVLSHPARFYTPEGTP
jgi:hypothetical protein